MYNGVLIIPRYIEDYLPTFPYTKDFTALNHPKKEPQKPNKLSFGQDARMW